MLVKIFDLRYYVSELDRKVLTINYQVFYNKKDQVLKIVNFNDFKKIDKSFLEYVDLQFYNKTEERIFLKKIKSLFYNSLLNSSLNVIEVKSFVSFYKKYFKDKFEQIDNFNFTNFYIVKCGTKEVRQLKNINTNLPFLERK